MANIAVTLQKIASNAQIQATKLANQATKQSFDYNAKEAATSRDWQKMMSDTSHQREVTDLKKAGLNPVLSANQGAQSYTTSSASAQANDPSSAVSNLAATQMQGVATGYAADTSARATRAAAAQQAAATCYAASAAAGASSYAARMSYLASKYHSDKAAEVKKYAVDNAKNANAAGLLSNYVNSRTGFNYSDFKKSTYSTNKIISNSGNKYLLNSSKGLSFNNLTWRSKQTLSKELRKYNIAVTMPNQKLVFDALVLKKSSAIKSFATYVNRYNQNYTSASNLALVHTRKRASNSNRNVINYALKNWFVTSKNR